MSSINSDFNYQDKAVGQSTGLTITAIPRSIKDNIDSQISYHKGEIEKLQKIRRQLEPILDVDAMVLRQVLHF